MIFDTLDQLDRYRGLGSRFARAFDFVKALDGNMPIYCPGLAVEFTQ